MSDLISNKCIVVLFKYYACRKTYNIQIKENETIFDLKQKINEELKENIFSPYIKMYYNNKQLMDNYTLYYYGIGHNSFLDICCHGIGGMNNNNNKTKSKKTKSKKNTKKSKKRKMSFKSPPSLHLFFVCLLS